MAGPINRAPQGLLDLLAVKSLGQQPDQLSELVRPVLDMLPFYVTNRRLEVEIAEGVGAAVGPYGTITVPQTEVWLVYAISSRLTTGVAQEYPLFWPRTIIGGPGAPGQWLDWNLRYNMVLGTGIPAASNDCNSWVFNAPLPLAPNQGVQTWNAVAHNDVNCVHRTEVMFLRLDA